MIKLTNRWIPFGVATVIGLAAIITVMVWPKEGNEAEAGSPSPVVSVASETEKPEVTIPDIETSSEDLESEETEVPGIILEPDDDTEQSTAVDSKPIKREDVQLPTQDTPMDKGK